MVVRDVREEEIMRIGFENAVLRQGNFELRAHGQIEGRLIGVRGISGAGKTSLIEMVAGIRRLESGVVCVDGQVWEDVAQRQHISVSKRGLGYVPQDAVLFPNRDVLGNLKFGMTCRNGSEGIEKCIKESKIVNMLELSALLKRSVAELSGGETRRVALGRALLSSGRYLLLDEVFGGLDESRRGAVVGLLRTAVESGEWSGLVVGHQEAELEAMCDAFLTIKNGVVEGLA